MADLIFDRRCDFNSFGSQGRMLRSLSQLSWWSRLQIIDLQLPSFFDNFDPRAAANFPSSVQAYFSGLTFALAASPAWICSASSKDPIIGGSLLLTYTTGYVAPLLLLPEHCRYVQSLLSFRKFSAWIN